jgi:hypothetical protein
VSDQSIQKDTYTPSELPDSSGLVLIGKQNVIPQLITQSAIVIECGPIVPKPFFSMDRISINNPPLIEVTDRQLGSVSRKNYLTIHDLIKPVGGWGLVTYKSALLKSMEVIYLDAVSGDSRVDDFRSIPIVHQSQSLHKYQLTVSEHESTILPFFGICTFPWQNMRVITTDLLVSDELVAQGLGPTSVCMSTSPEMVMERIDRTIKNVGTINFPRIDLLQNHSILLDSVIAATTIFKSQQQQLKGIDQLFRRAQGGTLSLMDIKTQKLTCRLIKSINATCLSKFEPLQECIIDRQSQSPWAFIMKVRDCLTHAHATLKIKLAQSSNESGSNHPTQSQEYLIDSENLLEDTYDAILDHYPQIRIPLWRLGSPEHPIPPGERNNFMMQMTRLLTHLSSLSSEVSSVLSLAPALDWIL